jgi:hypothetical protein
MAREDDDWRLGGQEKYLQGAALKWQPYVAWSDTWDHDHCSFCWAKFRPAASAGPGVLTEGYATTDEHTRGARYHWVCKQCFADFADMFEWRVANPN